MQNKNKTSIRLLTGIAVFSALAYVVAAVCQVIPQVAGFLTLDMKDAVISMAGLIYGPIAGFILGAVSGFLVFVAPSTMALFWDYGVLTTLLVCILKMAIAGFISGVLYKIFYKKNNSVAAIIASVCVPIINTGLFAVAAYLFYYDLLNSFAGGQNVMVFLFLSFIGINFIIELFVNSILSTVVIRLTNIERNKK